MAPDDPAPPPQMLAAVLALQDTVTMARALAQAGRQIDLTGLDADAAVLCAAIGLLPPARGRGLLEPLEALLQDVDDLTAVLSP